MNNLLNFNLQYFAHKHCDPTWKLEHQLFRIHGLVLILEGNAHYIIDGQPYEATAGTLIYFRPGCIREATTTDMTIAAIDFTTENDGFSLPTMGHFVLTAELERLIRDFQYEWLQNTPGKHLKCAALFLMILTILIYGIEETSANAYVEKIKRYIVQHFAEPLSLQQVANIVGLSPVYCGALFKKVQGCTLSQYINRTRVLKASDYLQEGVYNVTEISDLCGFNDLYYFSTTFKKILGVSPSKYKETHQGDVHNIL